MKNQIVFLGPEGATFSYQAYLELSELFSTPKVSEPDAVLVPVKSNTEIIKTVLRYPGSYGVIAMKTEAEGKVDETVKLFMSLLDSSSSLAVLGAVKMELHFALMARPGIKKEMIHTVLAHNKGLGACASSLSSLSIIGEERGSNGIAAEEVAVNAKYAEYGALAPASAAMKYGLEILDDSFEDEKAFTTFFLLGPAGSVPQLRTTNSALVVLRLRHVCGSLADALVPFKKAGINLAYIHPVFISNGEYGFVLEAEMVGEQVGSFHLAVEELKECVTKCLVFGPFGLVL